MAWGKLIDDRGERWEMNPDGVLQIARSFARSEAMGRHLNVYSKRTPIPLYLGLSANGPEERVVDVDWNGVRSETAGAADELVRKFWTDYAKSLSAQAHVLQAMRAQTRSNEDSFRGITEDATRQTMANVQRSVSRAETGQKIAEFTRDAAAGTLITLSSIATGGAAAAALGGGGILKGVAKYEDGKGIASAMVTATSEVVCGIFELGGVAGAIEKSGGAKVVKFVVIKMKATLAAANSFAEGKTMKEAAADAVSSVLGSVLSNKLAAEFEMKAIPATAVITSKILGSITGKLASDSIGEHFAERFSEAVAGHEGGDERLHSAHAVPILMNSLRWPPIADALAIHSAAAANPPADDAEQDRQYVRNIALRPAAGAAVAEPGARHAKSAGSNSRRVTY